MKYLSWNEKKIADFSTENIASLYNQGYLFTRKDKGALQQTRSVRIALSRFEPSSENRRILKKCSDIILNAVNLPFSNYGWQIGKMAKDFYDQKFGKNIMSVQKIKEILTDSEKSNFNLMLSYSMQADSPALGYAICRLEKNFLHYSYPFYDLNLSPKDMGMAMMVQAIEYAKSKGLDYIYLGSLQRPGDKYKLQFSGLEWFDGKDWQTDLDSAKKLLSAMTNSHE